MSAAVEIPPPGAYEIDPARSRVTFSGKHLFGLTVRGGFALRGGRIIVGDPLVESMVDADVDAASFDTGNRQRDSEIRSHRYLHTARFPVIGFRSGRVRPHGDGWLLEGLLHVQQATGKITLLPERATYADGVFFARATTSVDRTEFGIDAMASFGGRELKLIVDVIATAQES